MKALTFSMRFGADSNTFTHPHIQAIFVKSSRTRWRVREIFHQRFNLTSFALDSSTAFMKEIQPDNSNDVIQEMRITTEMKHFDQMFIFSCSSTL